MSGERLVHPTAVLGHPPMHRDHRLDGAWKGYLVGSGVKLEAFVVAEQGIWRPTVVGDDTWLMPFVLVGHDASIGRGCEIAAHSVIAAHSELEDVLFTIRLISDPAYKSPLRANWQGIETSSADGQTLNFKIKTPYAGFLNNLTFGILPKHLWESISPENFALTDLNLEPIGSGLFKLVEFKDNEFVHLATNKQHFLYQPKMDEVIFQTFDSPEALVEAIAQGAVDMITQLPLDKAAEVGQVPDVQMVAGRPYAPIVSDIIINLIDPNDCPADSGGLCTGHRC